MIVWVAWMFQIACAAVALLEDEDDDSVGRDQRDEVQDDCLQRQEDRAERAHQQHEGQQDHEQQGVRELAVDGVREVAVLRRLAGQRQLGSRRRPAFSIGGRTSCFSRLAVCPAAGRCGVDVRESLDQRRIVLAPLRRGDRAPTIPGVCPTARDDRRQERRSTVVLDEDDERLRDAGREPVRDELVVADHGVVGLRAELGLQLRLAGVDLRRPNRGAARRSPARSRRRSPAAGARDSAQRHQKPCSRSVPSTIAFGITRTRLIRCPSSENIAGISVIVTSTETAGISRPPIPIERITGIGMITIESRPIATVEPETITDRPGVLHRLDRRRLDVLAVP